MRETIFSWICPMCNMEIAHKVESALYHNFDYEGRYGKRLFEIMIGKHMIEKHCKVSEIKTQITTGEY